MTYPVVVIEVEGVKCTALIDTGAGSSYVSSKLISRLNKKPIRKESKRIETLMHSVLQKTAIYDLQMRDTNHEFTLKIELNKVEIPRSLTLKLEPITSVDLHIFGDKSILGCCAVANAVVSQPSKVNQGLVASKSRLSKKDITMPRLELIVAHMAANLATNIKAALKDLSIRSVIGWTDSTVVLHWLKDQGSYKVFEENRVKKILSHEFIR